MSDRQMTPQELVAPYLMLLNHSFGEVADFVEASPHSSDSAADAILANDRLAEDFTNRVVPRIFEASHAFWLAHEDMMLAAVRRLPGMKATFGGDVGPQRYFRQLERGGLYFDTVLVQDPLLRAMRIPELAAKTRVKMAIKYALELVWHTPLYLAPIAPPIAVLIPDKELGGTRQDFNARWAETEPWALLYWSEVLDKQFNDYAELEALVGGLRTSHEFLDLIKRPDLFRMDAEAASDPRSQWQAFLEEKAGQMTVDPRQVDNPAGILNMLASRLMTANDILNTAHTFGAQPLIGAPLSYHYTAWRGRAIQDRVLEGIGTHIRADLPQTNALLGAGLDWLGNVTEHQLLMLREKGRLDEMRQLFRSAAEGLRSQPVSEVDSISREMDHRLDQGLRSHEEEIRQKDEDFQDELKAKGVSLIVSVIGAAAPLLFPASPAWLLSVPGFVSGTNNIGDIVNTVIKRTREKERLEAAPLAILLDLKRDQTGKAEEHAPAIYVQPMPEFEWDPSRIGGVAYMIPHDRDSGLPMAIGPAFTDRDFARAFFELLRAWNADKDKDPDNNVRLSFIIEGDASYSMFLYPSPERPEVQAFFENSEPDDPQFVAHWVFCKRFDLASFRGLELFAKRYAEGNEFILGAFAWKGEGYAPEKIATIRPIIKKHFKLKHRAELRREEIEYWTGGDRTPA